MIASLRKDYEELITAGFQTGLLFVGLRVNSRMGWIVCLALIAILSLFAWGSALLRRRAITDTPTSRIASAAQGYVELLGIGRPPAPPPNGAKIPWASPSTSPDGSSAFGRP